MRASARVRAVLSGVFGFLTIGLAAPPAPAVLLYSTPQRNTWAPSGSIYNSGWQYQGRWGAFLGTPIAPRSATRPPLVSAPRPALPALSVTLPSAMISLPVKVLDPLS